MESLLQHHLRAGHLREAAVVARITAQALPAEAAPNYSAASLMLKLGEDRRAKKYLERSLQAAPDDPATLELLARTELLLEARPKAPP
jgi:predicted Zn-dependent protease